MRDTWGGRAGHRFRAWLVYDRAGAARNAEYIRMHREEGGRLGIEVELRFAEELLRMPELGDNCRTEPGTEFVKPDFAIVRTICPALSEGLEQMGIPVFNNAFVSKICNDKGDTIRYVGENTDVPVIPTERFGNERLTREFVESHPDCVIKAVDGHGGTQVFRTGEPYPVISAGIGTSDFVVQPFVRGAAKDVRVYVIGHEVIAAIERTGAGDFRSNFSLGGQVREYVPDAWELSCVEQICRQFSFGLVGIDFILDGDGTFLFNEIEDVVGARMLYQCRPGIPLLERYFTFIVDKILHCN